MLRSGFRSYRDELIKLSIGAALLSMLSCGPTHEIEKDRVPPPSVKKPTVPDITIHIASLNLAHVSKRVEKEDIRELAGILKKEKIDILAVQGVTRYPELKNRTDFVDELAAQGEMRSAFGETISLSGRQNGNAVFSSYPIQTIDNTHYAGLKSTGFEAALQVLIDCGIRDVVMVSTQLPERASPEEQISCVKMLASFQTMYSNDPIVIAGNLPQPSTLRSAGLTEDIQAVNLGNPEKNHPTKLWYLNHEALAPADARVIDTELGPLFISRFGIFRKPHP